MLMLLYICVTVNKTHSSLKVLFLNNRKKPWAVLKVKYPPKRARLVYNYSKLPKSHYKKKRGSPSLAASLLRIMYIDVAASALINIFSILISIFFYIFSGPPAVVYNILGEKRKMGLYSARAKRKFITIACASFC
jgi:hypothetical protein